MPLGVLLKAPQGVVQGWWHAISVEVVRGLASQGCLLEVERECMGLLQQAVARPENSRLQKKCSLMDLALGQRRTPACSFVCLYGLQQVSVCVHVCVHVHVCGRGHT